ncbi:hypothetical protein ES707_05497 [subsurface metagenome]
MDCYEEEHHRTLHAFRKKLNYYNNYTPKQSRYGKSHNNISVSWCPYCYSHRVEKKGIRRGKQRYCCKNCGKNWTFELAPDDNKEINKENNTLDHEEYKNNKHSSANDENVLAEKILQYLKNNPGEKARTIASNLRVDRRKVNSLLYGKLKGKCVAENFNWYLKWQLEKNNKYNFTGEFTIEMLVAYIENRKANNKPIVFYYRNDSFPRIIHEYFLDGRYVQVITDEGQPKTFLLDKIRKVE